MRLHSDTNLQHRENRPLINCEWECLKAGCGCKRGCLGRDGKRYVLNRDYDKPPARVCPAVEQPPRDEKPIYLGSKIKAALDSIGITQDRVAALVESIGLPPSCGGCAQRQEKLDEFDRKAREWLSKAKAWFSQ
jgi:hypothetical protein